MFWFYLLLESQKFGHGDFHLIVYSVCCSCFFEQKEIFGQETKKLNFPFFCSFCKIGFKSSKVIKKPQIVHGLVGKQVTQLSVGTYHAAAVTKNGSVIFSFLFSFYYYYYHFVIAIQRK